MIESTLGHYRIIEKLGEGSMGEVYLAEDTRLGRRVALKLLPRRLTSDETAKARFIGEARAASALDHPNICTTYDVEEIADGQLMLAMAYCDGPSIKERLAGGPLGAVECIEIASQIADGLSEAHAHGIVHRDIKPANVMLTRTGRVKIVDFGVARLPEEAGLTATGVAVGTPAYMAPEQARGEPVDARADLWALGVILYEMLTGRAPFTGRSSADTLYAVLHRAPEPIERLRPGVPPALVGVANRSLAKDPSARYQQAERLLADLTACKAQAAASAITAAPGAARRPPSIVVLPFANLSADPEQEYFCDGMTEELTTALSTLRALRVVAHTSALQFKGQAIDIRRIGEQLGAETVVEGSVRKSGQRLRVTAQLVNAADGYHLWSDRFDRQLDDVFTVQEEIARAIVEKLKVRLIRPPGVPLVKRPTDNMEAYQLYLKGLFYFTRRYRLGPVPAVHCFEQAIQLEPDFPEALAGLADCYTAMALYSLAPIGELLPKATTAVTRALALDDSCAEAHHALAFLHMFLDWNWPVIERGLTRALELNPDLPTTRAYYALALAEMGRTDEAIRETERATSLEPLSAFVAHLAGGTYYVLGLNQRAVDESRRSAELDPHMVLTAYVRALALSAAGRHDEAVDAARDGVATTERNAMMLAILVVVLGAAGRDAEARRLLAELVERGRQQHVSDGILAVACAGAGEYEAALETIERAVPNHDGAFPWTLFARAFDPVRRDPRFLKILAAIGYTGTSPILLGLPAGPAASWTSSRADVRTSEARVPKPGP